MLQLSLAELNQGFSASEVKTVWRYINSIIVVVVDVVCHGLSSKLLSYSDTMFFR